MKAVSALEKPNKKIPKIFYFPQKRRNATVIFTAAQALFYRFNSYFIKKLFIADNCAAPSNDRKLRLFTDMRAHIHFP